MDKHVGTVTIESTNGPTGTLTFQLLQVKAGNAHYAYCKDGCGLLPVNPYWRPAKTKYLHSSGTGHRVTLVAIGKRLED
jgi:hypothetical protein